MKSTFLAPCFAPAVSTFVGASSVAVEAGESEFSKVKSFNGPYRAYFE